jgi:hypothetical protein
MKEKFLSLLQDEIKFLEGLIVEIMSGGSSTQNVDAMRNRITYLKSVHYNISINNV